MVLLPYFLIALAIEWEFFLQDTHTHLLTQTLKSLALSRLQESLHKVTPTSSNSYMIDLRATASLLQQHTSWSANCLPRVSRFWTFARSRLGCGKVLLQYGIMPEIETVFLVPPKHVSICWPFPWVSTIPNKSLVQRPSQDLNSHPPKSLPSRCSPDGTDFLSLAKLLTPGTLALSRCLSGVSSSIQQRGCLVVL